MGGDFPPLGPSTPSTPQAKATGQLDGGPGDGILCAQSPAWPARLPPDNCRVAAASPSTCSLSAEGRSRPGEKQRLGQRWALSASAAGLPAAVGQEEGTGRGGALLGLWAAGPVSRAPMGSPSPSWAQALPLGWWLENTLQSTLPNRDPRPGLAAQPPVPAADPRDALRSHRCRGRDAADFAVNSRGVGALRREQDARPWPRLDQPGSHRDSVLTLQPQSPPWGCGAGDKS